MAAPWRYAYATAAIAIVGIVAQQAMAKGVWPHYQAHRFEYAGLKLKETQRFAEAETVLALAERHHRFKGTIRAQLVQMQIVNGKPDDALAVFAKSENEGISQAAYYWKGRAHQSKGDVPAALQAYERVIRYYDDTNIYKKNALAQAATLARRQQSPVSASEPTGGPTLD